MTDLTSVLLGGAITLTAGGLGYVVQGRREYSRWLRERRFDAYRRFMVEADLLNIGLRRKKENDFQYTADLLAPAAEAVSEIALVGPYKLYLLAVKYQDIAKNELEPGHATDWSRLVNARPEVGEAMQRVLGMKQSERALPENTSN